MITQRTKFVFVVATYPTTNYGETTINRFVRFKAIEDCTLVNLLKALKKDTITNTSIKNLTFFSEADFEEFSKGCHIIEA